MDQKVTDCIEHIEQPWQGEVCRRLRQIIHQSIPEVEERIQYGKPHCLRQGAYACVLSAAKGWVSVTIFNAATLEAPEDVFEPGGGERKTIKLRPGQPVHDDLLARLVHDASHP